MKARVLTAVVGIPLVLAVVGCTNPWPLAVLLVAAAFICEQELNALTGESRLTSFDFALPLAILLTGIILSSRAGTGSAGIALAAMTGIGVAGGILWIRGHRSGLNRVALYLWIMGPLATLFLLKPPALSHTWEWQFVNPLLLLLLPVWAGDIAAMLCGMAFGKHPLAPKISPKKTWEGAIANFIAATLVGWGVGVWLGYQPWVGPACGSAVGIFGQLGDLFESALKRAAGKKDSGTLLPGHGGLLDRIDALLGSVIPVWLILYFSGSI